MELDEKIVKHNQSIRAEIKALETQIEQKKKEIIPPCKFCRYDGVYRCETCAEENYAGYNIKDYPNYG
jgi:hypothetical protein